MPKTITLTQAALDAAIAKAIETALAAVPTSAPAKPKAESVVEHIGPSGKPDGRRFACTADGGCGRLLRSETRASIHGVDAGGHEPRKAE